MMPIRDEEELGRRLDAALACIDRYLADRRSGRAGPGTPVQLEALRAWFLEMRGLVERQSVPPKDRRMRNSPCRILVDDWDPADPLGADLLEINFAYARAGP